MSNNKKKSKTELPCRKIVAVLPFYRWGSWSSRVFMQSLNTFLTPPCIPSFLPYPQTQKPKAPALPSRSLQLFRLVLDITMPSFLFLVLHFGDERTHTRLQGVGVKRGSLGCTVPPPILRERVGSETLGVKGRVPGRQDQEADRTAIWQVEEKQPSSGPLSCQYWSREMASVRICWTQNFASAVCTWGGETCSCRPGVISSMTLAESRKSGVSVYPPLLPPPLSSSSS